MRTLMQILQEDRAIWVLSFERWMDRVQKGATYFVSRSLWNVEKIDFIEYPITHVLRMLNSQITAFPTATLAYEILLSVKSLIGQPDLTLYFEWQPIIKILGGCISNKDLADEIVQRPKIVAMFSDIFK